MPNEYLDFDSGDGIPFIVSATTVNGNDILRFVCPVEHGLTTSMYFEIQNNSLPGRQRLLYQN